MPTAIIIKKTDFAAEPVKLSTNKFTKEDLQGYIDLWEYKYLRRMLGDRICSEFLADLVNGIPQHPKFVALLNGVTYVNCQDDTVIYEGLKEPLKFIIFSLVLSKTTYVHTIVGVTSADNENSVTVSRGQLSLLYRNTFNQGVEMGRGINYFINNYIDHTATATSIALTSGITYTVLIPDTKYLKNGDKVSIDGTEYVIANLVDNTSFTVDSNTDISGSDVKIEWDIFGRYDVTPIEYTFMNR